MLLWICISCSPYNDRHYFQSLYFSDQICSGVNIVCMEEVGRKRVRRGQMQMVSVSTTDIQSLIERY